MSAASNHLDIPDLITLLPLAHNYQYRMTTSLQNEKINAGKTGTHLLSHLIRLSIDHTDVSEFLGQLVAQVNNETKAGLTAIVRGTKGKWRTQAIAPDLKPEWPSELLADVLDEEATKQENNWLATPLDSSAKSGFVVIQKGSALETIEFESMAAAVAIIVAR